MIGDGSGVANMRSARRWLAVLALGGAVAAPSAAPAQTMEFPHPFAGAAFGLTGVGR